METRPEHIRECNFFFPKYSISISQKQCGHSHNWETVELIRKITLYIISQGQLTPCLLTPDVAQYHLEQNLTASCLHCRSTHLTETEIPVQCYTSMEIYADKCTESQVCNDCTYRQNSLSEVLSEDVRLSIYFCFKVLNTLQNNVSRLFRIVLFILSFHARKLA